MVKGCEKAPPPQFRGAIRRGWPQIAALLLTFCPAALHAAPPAPPLPVPVTLTVTAGQGTVLDGPAAAHFDFGTRSGADSSPLAHVFVLCNKSGTPLLIDRLESSCGCTTAAAGRGGDALPLSVAPGQSVPLCIQVSPRRLLPGETHKSVWVYTHGAGDGFVLLEMRGVVQDDMPALPPSLSPKTGEPAPLLIGTDGQRRPFALSALRGHPVALLFFCGCPWCAAAAQAWGHVQRAGLLPPGTRTVVVFDGDRAAAAAFASSSALDTERTTLLPDPNDALTEKIYKVGSCPRVFSVDALGTIRYTNDHADDQPRRVSARTLTARLQASLGRPNESSSL